MSVLSQLGRYLPSKNVMGDYSDEEIYSMPECVLSIEKEDIRAKQNDLKDRGYFKNLFGLHISKNIAKYWLKTTKFADYQLNMG